jgi:hypothetical protein
MTAAQETTVAHEKNALRAKTAAQETTVDQETIVAQEKTADQETTALRAKTVAQETTVVRAKTDPAETAGSPENRGNPENPAHRAFKNPYLNLRELFRPKVWLKSCPRALDSCVPATTTT